MGGESTLKDKSLENLLARLSGAGPSRELWSNLLDLVAEELGSERTFVFRLRSGGGFRVLAARSHDREDIPSPEGRLSHYAVQRMAAQGRIVFVADARRDRRYKTEEALAGRRTALSLLVLPLSYRGEIRGGIYADHRFHALERPTELDMKREFLMSLASLALELSTRSRVGGRGHKSERVKSSRQESGEDVDHSSQEDNSVATTPPRVLEWFEGLLSANPDLCDTFDTLRALRTADLPVLICGETGTGKSVLARAIHAASARQSGPFVVLSCGAVPDELIESELLGHVKGAFTGAEADREGAFVEAHLGTLLLDEASDMSPALQRKLLRVLEDGRVRALGAKEPVQVDVRIIAATTRNLERMVREGRFRRDLYFRLKSLVIELPPLRDRREDVVPLAEHFLSILGAREECSPPKLDSRATALLLSHLWPGNVRELENEMRRVLALGRKTVRPQDLTLTSKRPLRGGEARSTGEKGGSLVEQVEAAERAAVIEALRRARGNKSQAAAELRITRKSLYRRIERHGLGAGQENVGEL